MIRALLWLQWRVLVNGMRQPGRDRLERASRVAQFALPVLLALLLIPVTLALCAAAVLAGWALARPGADHVDIALAVGFPLAIPFLWVLARPFVPAEHVRLTYGPLLRMLPIPTGLLQRLELVAVLVDPVVLPFTLALLALPLGSLAAGRPLLACGALAAALAYVASVACLGVLAMALVQLFLRDRRRAEAATLLFFLLATVGGWLPQVLVHEDRGASHTAPAAPTSLGERQESLERLSASMLALPPAATALAITGMADGRVARPATAIAVTLAIALAGYFLALGTERRLRETPARSSAGSIRASRGRTGVDLPFVSPSTNAVAWVHLRAFLRTTRGRMALVSPALVVVVFGMMATTGPTRGPLFLVHAPVALAAFGLWICLSNLATTLAANQFAVAGAGLVLEFLQPLDETTLLRGRTLGQAMILAIQSTLVVGLLVLIFPGLDPVMWPALLLGAVAVHFLVSPLFGLLSAVFPKSADLSRMGRAGNSSFVSSLLILPALPLGALPVAGLGWLTVRILHQPWLFPVLTAAWLALTVVIAQRIAPLVARAVAARRENLAMVATGR